MIEILTLFLGLYHGVQTVELEVGEPVAAVELRLDGEAAGTLSGPPWKLAVDLGPELTPHELIAVARDAEGRELGRARRWVNLEFEAAGADGAAEDPATAVVLSLDTGKRLPEIEEMQSWFSAAGEPLTVLRVERGAAEVVFVRDPGVQYYLDRTARFFFQLYLGDQDWDAFVLTDRQTFVDDGQKALLSQGLHLAAKRVHVAWDAWHPAFSSGADAAIRLLSPRAAPVSRVTKPMNIFNVSAERQSEQEGLLWHSTAVRPLRFPLRISDAVAMAGLEVHAGHRPRAVVLLLDDVAAGSGLYPPPAVRSYLEQLQVPLFIWYFGIREPSREPTAVSSTTGGEGWGEVRDLAVKQRLDQETMGAWLTRIGDAAEEVRKALRRQRVVWLEGAHLPSRVELSGEVYGVRFAGAAAAGAPAAGSDVVEELD